MALAETAALVASLELKDEFSKTADKFDRTVAGMDRKTKVLSGVGFQVGRGARNALDNIKGFVGNPLVQGLIGGGIVVGIGKVISSASDLNETISKTAQIFGQEAIPALEDWSLAAADAFGQSQQQALDAASTFAIFGKSAGLSGDELVDFSTGLTELSSDFASFFNTTPEDAITAIGAALRGESEPIRRYGVLLDAATLKQRALKLGLIETTTQALTPQQRVLAAQAEILAQTSDAQGDFARTGDGLANTQRKLQANLANTATIIGQTLLPAVTDLSHEALALLQDNQPAIKEFAAALPEAFDQLIEIGRNIPWGTIGTSLQLAGAGARTLLGAFTSMPDWVQTAVLTGWGLNKLTGGALGSIAATLTKGLFGSIRGATPATPVFTKEVGLGGGGPGGLPIVGGTGALAALGALGGIIGTAIGGALLLNAIQDAIDPMAEEGKEAWRRAQSKTPVPGAATPLGQFNAANMGGTTVPVEVTNAEDIIDPVVFKALTAKIDEQEKATTRALKESDLAAARRHEKNIEELHRQRGTIRGGFRDLIPHLGATNRALSLVNRNLDEGNQRQRDIASRVSEARDRIGNGFASSNRQLGVIASKDFSPNVNVQTNVSTTVSVSDIVRSVTHASFASQVEQHGPGSGFLR